MLITDVHALREAAVVGHKFARQASMFLAGFDVPEFVCLPAEAFDRALAALGEPAAPPGGQAEVLAWAKRVHDRLAAVAVPDDLAAEVLAAFDDIAGPDGRVAVRACVVSGPNGAGEDGADDPHAGLSSSFLFVSRDQLLSRIAGCWASAFNPHAVLYRLTRGTDPAGARVAVGVQRMIVGSRSFVAFSRDPRGGDERCVIAAGYGLGEGIVQEQADIDHFFVAPGGADVEAVVVPKRRMLVTDDGAGVAARAVPDELAQRPVLTDQEAGRLAELVARVAEHFGGPQDVEGTITASGRVHLVQARPAVITAPAEPAAPAGGADPAHWSRENVTESYPGISCALTFSQACDYYRRTFAGLYRLTGVRQAVLRRNDRHLQRMLGWLDGRIYCRLDSWYRLHGQVAAFELIRGPWERSMGTIDGERHRPRRAALAGTPRLLRLLLAHPRSVRRFLQWWDAFMERAADLDGRDPDELIALYRRMWAEAGARWAPTLLNTFFLMLTYRTADALLRRWCAPARNELQMGLLCGGRPNRSVAAVRSAMALAELAGARPGARAEICAGTGDDGAGDDELWRRVVSGRYGSELARAAQTHVRRYGDRAPNDLKLEQITPRQRPGLVIGVIRPYIQQGISARANACAERQTRQRAETALRAACPSPVRRWVLRAAFAGLRWFVRAREDTRFCRSQLFGVSRQVLLLLGRSLAEYGVLDDERDVVDLTVDEVVGAFEGTLPGTQLRALAAVRRAERRRHAGEPDRAARVVTPADRPVATALAAGPAESSPPSTNCADELSGMGSSPGVVRGEAKVVLDPQVSPQACHGKILIARETDPGWLFLMTAAKGIVVERGTPLSHTAITGRLLGIPTVVAVAAVTSIVRDGDLVELDGASGMVRVLERAAVS
ncbi:PEP/pyruvate-binding domain-containing protein [Streptomyces sp. 4N124]|uniref:PEP/pyruvate-binding domain-containing protein n=1 Tax=Streptomyces sp. 4N124 TaxID=3457420 RepID=UPI003FD4B737